MDVFISYSSNDRPLIMDICKAFDTHSITYWVDHKSIKSGENFAVQIPRAIEEAKVFLVFVSESSNVSDYVLREVDKAVKEHKTIIPVIVGSVTLSPSMDFYLSTSQFLPYSNAPAFRKDLVARILEILSQNTDYIEPLGSPPSFQGEPYMPKTASGKGLKIAIGVLLAAVLLLGIILVCIALGGRDEPPVGSSSTPSTTQAAPTMQTPSTEALVPDASTVPPTSEPTAPITAGENQIPERYAAEIEDFKASSSMAQILTTHEIRVGERFTPRLISIWEDCDVLSQDTSVAIAEGNVITGVSPGETYMIAVAGPNVTHTFKIIVTE